MSIVNNSNFNMPSLNGLVDITADSVNSTSISSDEISSKNVDTQTLYVNGLDLGTQVNLNAQKLTAITYTETPTPTTNISSNLDVSGNTTLKNLSVSQPATFNGNIIGNFNIHASTFDVSGVSIFNNSITAKGITSNGVCTFNSPVITNSSLICRSSIDVSTNSTFRKNLNILGELSVAGLSQFDNSLNILGNLYVTKNVKFNSQLDVTGTSIS